MLVAAASDQWMWGLGFAAMLLAYWASRWWAQRGMLKTNALRHRLTDGSLSPREQHYAFAHTYLRGLAFEDPDRIVIALAAPEADELLVELWNGVAKDLVEAGEEVEAVPPIGLEAIPARVAGRPCALVKMPAPRATTEAYFVAIVLNHDVDEPAKPAPEPGVYFFTLEMGFAIDGAPRTAFGEWDSAAIHRQHGEGPPADGRAFLDHIARHLTQAKPATSNQS